MLTDRQKEILTAVNNNNGNYSAAARDLGISRQGVDKQMQLINVKRNKAGSFEGNDVSRVVGEGYSVKKMSVLLDKQGEIDRQWVQICPDKARVEMALREAFEALSESIPPAKAVKAPVANTFDLLSTYVITDYHLGMLAWGEETGEDWDTNRAELLLEKWFESAIKMSPDSHTAIFAQMGDFMHWDGLDAVTPTNRHVLDADTRFQRLVRVAMKVLRKVIKMLLEKHQHVHIIMAEGNHDLASSIWLREMFAQLYRDEPRISVDTNPDPYYGYEWGLTSLFFHHGHKKRMNSIDDVFAAKFREMFGRTKFSYAHMGHLHHQVMQETSLMVLEQHRTLASPDAHASRGGWLSGKDAKVITYHREYGEVSRIVLSPEFAFSGKEFEWILKSK